MKSFCNLDGLKSLVSVLTCFKNLKRPSCIDLIFTNSPIFLYRNTIFETGLSDFHL